MLNDVFEWFLVMANNKSVTLVIFVMTFLAILIYVYGSKKRNERLETYRNIPFLDDNDIRVPHQENGMNSHTVSEKR